MKIRLYLIAVAVSLAGGTRAESQGIISSSPEEDFINNPSSAFFGVSKEEILRIELDTNGDGNPTVFITWKGFGSKAGHTWTAYVPSGRGYMRFDKSTGSENAIQFREDTVFAGKFPEIAPDGGLIVYYPGKMGKGPLVHYNFSKEGVISGRIKDLDLDSRNDADLFQKLFGRAPHQPLPQEYFENPPYRIVSVEDIRARAVPAERREEVSNEYTKPDGSPVALTERVKIERDLKGGLQHQRYQMWPFVIGAIAALGILLIILRVFKRN